MSASDSGAGLSHPDSEDATYGAWVGRVIDDRYRIDGLLGEGGMGAVFEAEHLKLMKKVALKVIHPEFAGDGEVAERFAREAMASAQMDHPHIAGATDYGILEEGGAYLVMQFVRGLSLRETIEAEGRLDWVRACEISSQIAAALSVAHKRKIVHRDLKPDNVMLEPTDEDGVRVKVLDFGIARVADEKIASGGPALTRVGTVIGTPGYMAPEQALGEPVDHKIDLYALGLLLYEMITGERLFEIDDLTAIVTRQLTEDAPRLSETAPGAAPEALEQLVAQLLEKEKAARPESAAEVRETLRQLLLGATLQAVASGETELPHLAASDLAGAVRDPTPLGVALDRATPEVARAPTVAAARARGPVATARTAVGGLARPSGSPLAQSGLAQVPKPAIFAAGCAAIAVFVFTVGGALMLFGGDDARPEIVKQEHRGERPELTLDEPVVTGMIPTPGPTRASVPSELTQALADINLQRRSRARRAAADRIVAHQPQDAVPEFLRVLAELERERACLGRREHVVRLGELGDRRALPALERLNAEPRNGCRRGFRRIDCHRCLREPLEASIASLRGG